MFHFERCEQERQREAAEPFAYGSPESFSKEIRDRILLLWTSQTSVPVTVVQEAPVNSRPLQTCCASEWLILRQNWRSIQALAWAPQAFGFHHSGQKKLQVKSCAMETSSSCYFPSVLVFFLFKRSRDFLQGLGGGKSLRQRYCFITIQSTKAWKR